MTELSLDRDIKILVAEDNASVRDFILRALKNPRTTLIGACDGQQALGLLAREKFDLLITDIVMPNVDGIALALKATQLYPDLRVVMISGYAQERLRAHNLETLAHQIIPKPFALEDLAEAVCTAMKDHHTPT